MNLYKNMAIILLFILLGSKNSWGNIWGASPFNISNTTYKVKNAEELHVLKPQAGDTIILIGRDWQNSVLQLKGSGTKDAPIVFQVADPKKTKFSKNSNLIIDGTWLIADGFVFKDGFSMGKDVITFSKKSSHCTLMNSGILHYNPNNKDIDYKWVSLHGTHNTVINCEFTGKTHSGTTLVVWLNENPNHHQILHNYFGHRPDLGKNGGETIRIGTSHWSMHSSKTLVKGNTFDNCDGEIEIISVKSCHNILENNLFFECAGTLTLRHGNDNIVRNNHFIGNNKANTGGIRIIGERHQVSNNHLYKLKGTSLRAPISVMNTVKNPELNEYFQVIDVQIDHNVILDCTEGIVFGSGANTTRVLTPKNLSVTSNTFLHVTTPLTFMSEPIGLEIKDNFQNIP